MRPMALLAAGVAVVAFDLRVGEFDLLADVVGWVLCLLAAFSVRAASPWFQLAIIASAAGILLSLRGSIRSPAPGLLDALEILVQTVVVFAVCSGIIDRLRAVPGPDPRGDRSVTTQARTLRWLDVVLAGLGIAVVLAVRSSVASAVALGLAILLAGLVLIAWFLVLLVRIRTHPSLQPADVSV